MNNLNPLAEFADLLRAANRILFITGAGVSADSGLPTYRGVGGLYADKDTDEGIPIEAALSAAMFRARPDITWKYLWQIGASCAGAVPNAAHRAIADLTKQKPDVWVLTQNVDGLHRAAGTKNLIEAHGHAFDLFCVDCEQTFTADELLQGYQRLPELPPRCTRCSGVVRPNVTLFDEMLSRTVQVSLSKLYQKPFDLVVSIGTTAVFPYICEHIEDAHQAGIPSVEINPVTTELSQLFSHRLRMTSVEAMGSILERMAG